MNFNNLIRLQRIPIVTSTAQLGGIKQANGVQSDSSQSSSGGGWLNTVATLLPLAAGAYATVATANNGTYQPQQAVTPTPAAATPVIVQTQAAATPAASDSKSKTTLYAGIAIAVVVVVVVAFILFKKK